MSRDVIGVIGLGPVGSILAAYLAKGGAVVYGMEVNKERAEQVRNHGIIVRGHARVESLLEDCFTTMTDLAKIDNLSGVFVCTKTWSIERVMGDFTMCRWPDDLRLCALMNGIGPEDAIGDYVGRDRVSRAVANFAGNLNPDGEVTMNWFHPPNILGPATNREAPWCERVCDLLTFAGLTTHYVSHLEMKKAAFFKTVLNSALNALCSAHGLTMGQAMRLKHTRGTAKTLLREGLTVAALVGYNYGEDALYSCLKYLEGGGDHYPSMWFDLKHRRPTEIEYINGKMVKIGRMFKNIDVDLNLYFTSAIVTQEIKNGTRTEDDIPEYLIDE